jgi:polysaccharide biosynthesis transport protein
MSDTSPPAAPLRPNALPESSLTPYALWQAVRKGWLFPTVALMIGGLAALFYTMGQTKIYEAEATILFDPQTPQPLGKEVQAVVDLSGDYLNKKEYYKTQFWVIQSQRIAIAVVKQLALNEDARFIGNLPPGAKVPARTISVDDAANLLRRNLSVEQVRDSRLAKITYQDADPTRAQRILSVLVDTYTRSNMDDAQNAMSLAGDWLGDQVTSLKGELESSELALHSYKVDKNILSVSMDDQSNMLRGEIQQLNTALTAARAQREQIGARRAELAKINPEEPSNIPATELLNSSLLQKLRAEYVAAVSQRLQLLASGKGDAHPDVRVAATSMEATRSALLAEVKNVQGAVEHDYGVSTKTINGVSSLLDMAKARALDLNLLEIEYNRLKRSKENNEKMYGIVTERSKENDLTRLLRFNNLRVVDRPQLPRKPVSPNLPVNVAGGLAIGLLLGLVGAIGREQLDRSIKNPEDAERELGLPFLGLIPFLGPDGKRGSLYASSDKRRRRRHREPEAAVTRPELVVHDHPASGISEAARAVRTNILFMSPDHPFHTLLVTSAAPAEGKTTVACCIAVAMAQAGKRVALLDCDMRRPRIHKIFGMSNDAGITTALLDRGSLESVVTPTEVPNLWALPTGPIPPNPAELLHSESFHRLLKDLEAQFDHIIIDSPPIAPVTDATILSTRVDGTVLVARAFRTKKDVARRSVRSLRDVGGKLVGTILNAVNFERSGYDYYQYYYYRQGGYGQDVPAAPENGDSSPRNSPPA